ncbi:MAG: hypothetical protein Q9222_005200 [Ikaeria aurantiellina]
MPPSSLLSPPELSYLHTSLSLNPPIRPDARSPTTFRPLVAETDLLPSANGSARLCFADGTEAIVGVKAEVERTAGASNTSTTSQPGNSSGDADVKMHSGEEDMDEERKRHAQGRGQDSWIEVTVDMPGFGRDDDRIVVFLAQMLQEVSRIDEDPHFNDDWDAAQPLYGSPESKSSARPPFTLLVISVGDNIFFDPSREELAVADAVCAATIGTVGSPEIASLNKGGRPQLRLLSLRTIDPPARLAAAASAADTQDNPGVWKPARGGMKRSMIGKMVKMIVEPGGVGEEVMQGLEGFNRG